MIVGREKLSDEFDIKMRRGNTLYCPRCGKKASTFQRPSDHRMADYRLECDCTSLKCYVTFTLLR